MLTLSYLRSLSDTDTEEETPNRLTVYRCMNTRMYSNVGMRSQGAEVKGGWITGYRERVHSPSRREDEGICRCFHPETRFETASPCGRGLSVCVCRSVIR